MPLLLFLLSCVWNSAPSKPAAGQGPTSARSFEVEARNVLVLVLDDVGTNAVRAYKEVEDLPRTPVIDGLARDGVLFRNAYSYPTCSAARAALLTGRVARRTGIGDAIDDNSADRLAHGEITLAEMVPPRWSTAALGKWHLTGQKAVNWPRDPMDQGFDSHRGSPANLAHPGPDGKPTGSYTDWDKLDNGVLSRTDKYATIDTADDAIAAIRDMQEPWLTWVAFNAPHEPYHVPPERLLKSPLDPGASRPELFRAAMEALDHEIGRLLDRMDPNVLARTMVVVIGDNGTPSQAVPPPFNGREAKFTLYEGGTNVPLIISGAGVGAKGQESAALVHAVDLFPTVARVAGVKVAELERGGRPVRLDGKALQPLLAQPDAAWDREILVSERFLPAGAGPYTEEHLAARDRRYKWMEVSKGGKTETFFFDLKDKPNDGPNLLGGALDEKQEAALKRLRDAARTHQGLRYENG